MPKFEGKNTTLPTSKLAFDRGQYNLHAFPSNNGLGPQQVVDFNFAERTFYGRVNRSHDPVLPMIEYIRPIYESNNDEQVVLAMNFVTQQFNAFQEHYLRACRMRLIPMDDPILSKIKAYRGYEDPIDPYLRYVDNVFNTYNKDYLFSRNNDIRSFDDYIRFIPDYMNQLTSIFPITLSGFMRSNHSSIFYTGLAIDVANISFSDDEIKQASILESNVFQYYITMAKQYGFSVNKRNPGVLICDLESPATAIYKQNYELFTTEDIFANQFRKTVFEDASYLSSLLVDYYNTFIDLYPVHRDIYICGDTIQGQKLTSVNAKEKNYIYNINNINKIYELYIKIRNIEERKPYTDRDIEAHIKTALRYNRISEETMLTYVEDLFRMKYMSKRGTLTYVLDRQKKKLDKPD